MNNFTRGRNSKEALNVGLLKDVSLIVFQTNIRSMGHAPYTVNHRTFPISNFILRNGKFDKKKIHAKLKEIYWVYKLSIEKRKTEQDRIESVDIEIGFTFNENDLATQDEKSNKILEMLW